MAQEAIEEYLEAIYDLELRNGSAKTTSIAKCLKVAPASVTEILKNLSDKGFVRYQPYHGVTLTEAGYSVARAIKRKHRLLEVFLTDILKLDREKVHEEACRMEHTISEDTENALCKMLHAPAHCPHGSPISPCNRNFSSCSECIANKEIGSPGSIAHRNENIRPITELKPGQCGIIAFIRGNKKIMQRLCDLGLTLGTGVSVERKAPLHGPIEICVRRTRLAIDHSIAETIFIKDSEVCE